jgi:Tol biopolymer transport system component
LTEYSGSWSKHFDWNKELKLLVYLEHSREPYYTGYRISVTNLDGTYYKNYTIGDYQDLHPVWGPDGKTIIFNRKIIGDDIDVSGKIMIIDCKTGMIREFITPDMIPNCLSLSYPDF